MESEQGAAGVPAWKEVGYARAADYEASSLLSKVTHSWVSPLMEVGKKNKLTVKHAIPLVSKCDQVGNLVKRFEACYDHKREQSDSRQKRLHSKPPGNGFRGAIIRAQKVKIMEHTAWALMEVIVRVSSPAVLKQFIQWVSAYHDEGRRTNEATGWLWALALGLCGFLLLVIHHQLFWVGMRMGFVMKQQAIAAVQQKLLKLNGSAVNDLSSGNVVNLVSGDVRRFEDFGVFTVFLLAAPLELLLVLLLVSLELGFLPAFAGISTILLIIPIQARLASRITHLRTAAAARTDERVRLTGELIEGALSVKMLCWELPFQKALRKIRALEASYMLKMLLIEAISHAFMFFSTPLASFVTFSVAVATGTVLSLDSVFFVIALLHLPKLSVATFFVKAVKTTSETTASMRRINDFLLSPEAVGPADSAIPADCPPGTVKMCGADFAWWSRAWASMPDQVDVNSSSAVDSKTSHATQASRIEPPEVLIPETGSDSAEAAIVPDTDVSPDTSLRSPTLRSPRFEVEPGELIGICGEVGCGKSSLLSALLGELQPIPGLGWVLGDPIPGRPVVSGSIAYCEQVPWIVAGSVRANVTFGLELDEERYLRAVSSCALDHDIAQLSDSHDTEIGERGINLSGGQKARLALARAAYSQADVCLLDDPLSAVDPSVARKLFTACIGPGGVMGQSTRILVTHQVQWLKFCDRIMVVRNGSIAAFASWKELQSLPHDDLPELSATADETHLDDDTYTHHSLSATPSTSTSSPVTARAPSLAAITPLPITPIPERGNPTVPSTSSSNSLESLDTSRQDRPIWWARDVTVASPAVTPDQLTSASGTSDDNEDDNADHAGPTSISLKVQTYDLRDTTSFGLPAPPSTSLPAQQLSDGTRMPVSRLNSALACENFVTAGSQPLSGENSPGGPVCESVGDGGLVSGKGASGKGDGIELGGVSFALDGKSVREVSHRKESGQVGTVDVKQVVGPKKGPANSIDETRVVQTAQKLVEKEDQVSGSVSWKVYWQYAKLVGLPTCAFTVFGLIAGQSAWIISEWWLAKWSESSDQKQDKWIPVYGGIVAGIVVLSLARSTIYLRAGLAAGTKMNHKMLESVMRAPLSFFHTNPTGRILNRFSKDQGAVDEQLSVVSFDALVTVCAAMGAFVIIGIANPIILPIFLPVGFFFLRFRSYYLCTSRDVKRFEAVSRSPVYSMFSSTLRGLATIRAYRAHLRFRTEFLDALNLNGAWWLGYLGCSRWLGFRIDALATFMLGFAAILTMLTKSLVSPTIIALGLTHLLQLAGSMQWAVRQTAEAENHMTSTERLLSYCDLPQERPTLLKGGKPPPKEWPTSISLEFRDVTARYRPGLPLVLKGLSFKVTSGQSCGIVGRTGSGKSSLMLSLFNLIDIQSGSIYIDNIDTSSIALDSLRKQIAVIPQDPLLFSGTLRANLDPWETMSDAQLWQALESVRLKQKVQNIGGLHTTMSESGTNLSAGQRQLLCLARALLSDARILALDEATANVDRQTDAIIQDTLRAAVTGQIGSKECIMLVIAHRVNTIKDCDQVIVLSDGKLVEGGAPSVLAASKTGVFGRLVTAAAANERQSTPGLED